MKSQLIITEYSNGAIEIIATGEHLKKIKYNTGDVLYFYYNEVVFGLTHDNISITNNSEISLYDINLKLNKKINF